MYVSEYVSKINFEGCPASVRTFNGIEIKKENYVFTDLENLFNFINFCEITSVPSRKDHITQAIIMQWKTTSTLKLKVVRPSICQDYISEGKTCFSSDLILCVNPPPHSTCSVTVLFAQQSGSPGNILILSSDFCIVTFLFSSTTFMLCY